MFGWADYVTELRPSSIYGYACPARSSASRHFGTGSCGPYVFSILLSSLIRGEQSRCRLQVCFPSAVEPPIFGESVNAFGHMYSFHASHSVLCPGTRPTISSSCLYAAVEADTDAIEEISRRHQGEKKTGPDHQTIVCRETQTIWAPGECGRKSDGRNSPSSDAIGQAHIGCCERLVLVRKPLNCIVI